MSKNFSQESSEAFFNFTKSASGYTSGYQSGRYRPLGGGEKL